MIDRPNQYTAEDLALGAMETLHSLMAWLVMSGISTPDKAAGIIEITAAKLEKRGEHQSAAAVRSAFQGALGDEWASMKRLLDPDQTGGNA